MKNNVIGTCLSFISIPKCKMLGMMFFFLALKHPFVRIAMFFFFSTTTINHGICVAHHSIKAGWSNSLRIHAFEKTENQSRRIVVKSKEKNSNILHLIRKGNFTRLNQPGILNILIKYIHKIVNSSIYLSIYDFEKSQKLLISVETVRNFKQFSLCFSFIAVVIVDAVTVAGFSSYILCRMKAVRHYRSKSNRKAINFMVLCCKLPISIQYKFPKVYFSIHSNFYSPT